MPHWGGTSMLTGRGSVVSPSFGIAFRINASGSVCTAGGAGDTAVAEPAVAEPPDAAEIGATVGEAGPGAGPQPTMAAARTRAAGTMARGANFERRAVMISPWWISVRSMAPTSAGAVPASRDREVEKLGNGAGHLPRRRQISPCPAD